jgi:hypothetical protein
MLLISCSTRSQHGFGIVASTGRFQYPGDQPVQTAFSRAAQGSGGRFGFKGFQKGGGISSLNPADSRSRRRSAVVMEKDQASVRSGASRLRSPSEEALGLGFQQAVKMGPNPIAMAIEDLPVVIPGVESHGPGQLETGELIRWQRMGLLVVIS